jgi:MraZ protein
MYTGRYYHKLDDKNRFSLPASFRENLGNKVIVTKGLDGCLFIFDLNQWSKKLEEAGSLEYTKKTNRDFVRLLTNDALEIEIDEHGRVLLGNYLKELAGLKREIVIVGTLDRVEIWDQTNYHAYMSKIEAEAEEIAELISQK